MIKYKDYIEESVLEISDRLIILLEHLRDNINESFSNKKEKRIILYDNIIKSKAIQQIRRFEGTFIDELHITSKNIKKINFKIISDKEFIEWLDKFLLSYYNILKSHITTYLISNELTLDDFNNNIKPDKINKLIIEFNLFVFSLRTVFNEIPKSDKIQIFSGKDIERIENKNYDLVDLAKGMIEPSIIESNIIEEKGL